jgi:type IV pilus biogenesis protein CpaD/CtpE
MNRKLFSALCLTAAMALSACAAKPEAQTPEPKWDVATEEEVAKALDLAVAKAAKDYVQLKKDGVLMFCKRSREIGSNIPTLKCLTEAQLRTQVQNMTKYRDDMRQRSGRCTIGRGCDGGG